MGRLENYFLKWGRRAQKFEKPCCRWWTAWRGAISCCFGRPSCFGHSETFRL